MNIKERAFQPYKNNSVFLNVLARVNESLTKIPKEQ